jgi:hypothetical protein
MKTDRARLNVGLTLYVLAFSSVWITLVISAGNAGAAPSSEDPEKLISEGVRLRRQGQDSRAEGYFKRAHELAATPRTAAQLGLVELALQEFAPAEAHLDEALRNADAWVREHRQVLEDGATRARQHLLRVEIVGAPVGTTFTSNGGDAARLPADGVLWLTPGAPTVLALEAPGHRSASARAAGEAGETKRLSVDMPPLEAGKAPVPVEAPVVVASPPVESAGTPRTEAGPPTAPSDHGRALRIGGIVVGAVGVVTDVVGVALLSQGLSKRDDTVSASNSNGAIQWNPSDRDWETLRNAGVGCLVGGSIALAAGVGLFVYGTHVSSHEANREGNAPTDGATVSFVPREGFGVLSLQGAF